MTARIIGVKHILDALPSGTALKADPTAIEHMGVLTSLITNCSEDVSVLKAVYETAPNALACALLADRQRFNVDVIGALSSKALPNADRSAFRLHLDYFARVIMSHVANGTDTSRLLAEKLFLPFLLFSKPKQKRASIAWDVIFSLPQISEKIDILKGCGQIVTARAQDGDEKFSSEDMADINEKLANRIAGMETWIFHFHFPI